MSGRTFFARIETLAALCFAFYASSAAASDVIADAGLFTVKIVTAIAYPFEQEFKGTASGAGFLVDRERGWILTNAHVAGRSPSSVQVSFNSHPFERAEKISRRQPLGPGRPENRPFEDPAQRHSRAARMRHLVSAWPRGYRLWASVVFGLYGHTRDHQRRQGFRRCRGPANRCGAQSRQFGRSADRRGNRFHRGNRYVGHETRRSRRIALRRSD